METAFTAARQAITARAALTGFAILVIGSSIVAVLWIGASDVFAGRMTGGELSQFLLYSILAAGSLAALSEVWGELSQAAGAAERLSELLEITPEIRAPLNPIPLPDTPRGEIRFEDVSFAYQAAGNLPVVQDLTLTIAPGEKVAVVGPSGAGKSTLFSLLMRFYDPTSGAIRMNGVELRDLDPDELRRNIALVPQDTAVFGASIAENIAYGLPDAKRQDNRQSGHGRPCLSFHRNHDEWLRHTRRRTRHHLVGRATPTNCHCPCRVETGSCAVA